jgi:hypothetical protein
VALEVREAKGRDMDKDYGLYNVRRNADNSLMMTSLGVIKEENPGFATVNNKYMLHQLPSLSCQNCLFLHWNLQHNTSQPPSSRDQRRFCSGFAHDLTRNP